jgi:ParB-like nuclease domain
MVQSSRIAVLNKTNHLIPICMIKINNELKALIQPLSQDKYKELENSILAHGCREPLIVCGRTLIDGHNRYDICTKHGLSFNNVNKRFSSENSIKLWVIERQLLRKDLTDNFREKLQIKIKRINQSLKDKWIKQARKGLVTKNRKNCMICGKYRNITESHHLYPLHLQYDDGIKLPIHDYIWLCPNHHKLVHRCIDTEGEFLERHVNKIQSDIFHKELMDFVTKELIEFLGNDYLIEIHKIKKIAFHLHNYRQKQP